MKELKKNSKASKGTKAIMVKIDQQKVIEGSEKKEGDVEKENELIKQSIKKQYRKKKVYKVKKNHPKKFNSDTRDQMAGFK